MPDYKNSRMVELLSRGEMYFWYMLRFRDDVLEIREQFPLDLETTVALAHFYGIRHPKDTRTRMTSDFLVDYADGHQEVFSVKNSRESLNRSERCREKLFLEQKYWESQGVKFHIVFTEDIDILYANNIRVCSYFYHESSVYDHISLLKHMIINKEITVDLHQRLDMAGLLDRYREEVNWKWKDMKKGKSLPGQS